MFIVAVGDEEHHRLRMLLDQVFDSSNFLANVTWQGSGKNDAKYTAGGVDYMLMYAVDSAALVESGRVWREPKPGIDTVLELAAGAWKSSGHDAELATKLFRAELRKIRSELEPAVFRYDQIDAHGRVFQPDNLTSPNPRPNLTYEVIHPSTGKPVATPKNGWRYSRETMAELVASDRILFGPDETTSPRFKRLLSEQEERVPYPTFVQARMPGSKHVEGILGDDRFPNPKDYRVLARWLGAVAPADSVILDYFGGSGSTAEAVMRLNEEDGGTRRCVLVTNNEVAAKDARRLRKNGFRHGDPEWEARGVYEYVAKPRVETVVSGIRSDGSPYSDGLEQNVEFFTLTYEAPLRVSTNREFAKIAPFLWLRAGSCGRRIDDISAGWDVAEAYGVIADLDQSEQFLKAMDESPSATHAFIVTDEDRLFEAMVRQLPAHVEPVRLYEAYLRNFEIEAGRGAR
jgi:adenine-specific DNA-methyltransferase